VETSLPEVKWRPVPGSYQVEVEPLSACSLREHGTDLVNAHCQECESEWISKLSPDWEAIAEAQRLGQMFLLGAWGWRAPLEKTDLSTPRELVGYAAVSVTTSLHYADHIVGHVGAMFVSTVWRQRGAGKILMDAVRRDAKAAGVHALFVSAKPGSAMETFMAREGLVREECIYRVDL